jgi:branched-subunit amino acid transport protein
MTLLAMVLAGLGSYALRALPLLVLPHVDMGPRGERMIRDAGTAALTALVVSSLSHRGPSGDLGPALVAVAVAIALSARGESMLRIVACGGAAYASAVVAGLVVG